MSIRLRLEMLSPDYGKQMAAETRKIARAATASVTEAAALSKAEGKSSLAALGRLQHAMYAKVFPGHGDSLHPAAVIGVKVDYASVFEEGATISGKPLLWLPLDNAPRGRGGKRMGPGEFTKNVGVLYSINRPGKAPLLAAVVRETDARAKNAPSLRLLQRGRNPGGRGTVRLVPMFVGVPSVTDPKITDVRKIIQRHADELPELYERNWNELNRG
ncbi:DUF6441 family protein [Bradyrhizobium sp. Pha-3]|uniref:DUF6441 family protein n=1 Tax=Bradyrhizobium sp. Pha-3 TaxID=208375 RepID=UPI0035D3E772